MSRRLAFAAALAAFAAAGASAQDAAPETPGASIETFEQWTLRCVPRDGAPPCDVVQILTDPASGAQVLAVSIARSPTEAIDAIQIVAPLGVHLPSGLGLKAGDLEVQGVRFTRCELQGCFVEARLGEDMLAAMQGAETLALTFATGPEQPVTIDVDLAGFGEAYAALLARSSASSE
jgi:invasion protein IalB